MTIECPGPGWKKNDGLATPPKGTKGKRVDVVLANKHQGMNWPADGTRPAARWTLLKCPFDIVWFRVR